MDVNVLISQILMLDLSSIETQLGEVEINLHATMIAECPSNFPMNDLVNEISGHHTFLYIIIKKKNYIFIKKKKKQVVFKSKSYKVSSIF